MNPNSLTKTLINVIATTNGIPLEDTLELAALTPNARMSEDDRRLIKEFRLLISSYHRDEIPIEKLFDHPVADALSFFFKNFPLPFKEEHTHLTGALPAEFVTPFFQEELAGPSGKKIKTDLETIYGKNVSTDNVSDIAKLLELAPNELFDRYLQLLYIPKVILTTKERHILAAKYLATTMIKNHNVGMLRLKFTLARTGDQVPGVLNSEEDVVMGLYEGLMSVKKEFPHFQFVLSPSFRKESYFYDQNNYEKKEDHFIAQVQTLIKLLDKYPELSQYLTDVDTVGNERDLFRKEHFSEMRYGLRKLKYRGLFIRSHHGEVWHTLRKGVQAVDNAMNIWQIDTLEHGLSLGINPNYYFHRLFQRVMENNIQGVGLEVGSSDEKEISEMEWREHKHIREKLLKGFPLNLQEEKIFTKVKFHSAREVEHYQHDVLNRLLDKGISLVALPSSNNKLTTCFPDYKDHPFTWWEKKGVQLGIGTDNYVTLGTNYIKELLLLLFTDPQNLKITKLLMVATGENRRQFMGRLLWQMREKWN